MLLKDVIEYYGSKSKACDAIKLTRGAASYWGYIVPEAVALSLEGNSRGQLKYDTKMYDLEEIYHEGVTLKQVISATTRKPGSEPYQAWESGKLYLMNGEGVSMVDNSDPKHLVNAFFNHKLFIEKQTTKTGE